MYFHLLNIHTKLYLLVSQSLFSWQLVCTFFFSWLFPYFVKGFRNQITEDDMPGPLKSHDSSRLGDKLEKAWEYQVSQKEKPSLLKALLTVFYKELSVYGLLLLVQEFIVK